MTRAQLDSKIEEVKNYIADKMKDIGSHWNTISGKTPDEEAVIKRELTKMSDFIDDIFKSYGTLGELEYEDVDEDSDGGGYFNY